MPPDDERTALIKEIAETYNWRKLMPTLTQEKQMTSLLRNQEEMLRRQSKKPVPEAPESESEPTLREVLRRSRLARQSRIPSQE